MLLTLADNVLNAFGKLRDIALLDILADLHRLLKFLEVWCIIGENNDSLIVDLRIHDEPLIGRTVIVTCDGHDTQAHSTGRRAIQRLVDILIIGEVVLAILELLGRIRSSPNTVCAMLAMTCALSTTVFLMSIAMSCSSSVRKA